MQSFPLAVVAALDDEIRPLLARTTVDARIHIRPGRITRGTYGHTPLLLVRSGIGRRAMRGAVSHLLAGYRPGLVLHVGYCGGADPELAPGDLVIADSVVDAASGNAFACDAALLLRGQGIVRDRALRSRTGRLVTVDRVASSPHDKAFLATQHAAIGIDMESAELAAALAGAGVPFLVIRAVLDPLDDHLPDISDAIDEDGSANALALVTHLVRKPSEIARLPRIQYLASHARAAIAAFVDAWIGTEET